MVLVLHYEYMHARAVGCVTHENIGDRWPKYALAALVHLSVQKILSLIGACRRGEGNRECLKTFVHAVEQTIHNGQGLKC